MPTKELKMRSEVSLQRNSNPFCTCIWNLKMFNPLIINVLHADFLKCSFNNHVSDVIDVIAL